MLVLSRKEGEKIVIGDNIVVTINRLSGNRVAVGIEAPREVSIVRGELNLNEVADVQVAVSGTTAVTDPNIAVASKPFA